MKNRIISLILCACLLVTAGGQALAAGNPNMDNGGDGEYGTGTDENKWGAGWEGVRVTVVRASDKKAVSTPVDFTNKSISKNTIHFGKVHKLQYKSGTALSPKTGNYSSVRPNKTIPRIIQSASNSASIEDLKNYWRTAAAANMVAKETGLAYETITNGSYVLLLEPMAYLTYESKFYALTATEAGLYMQKDKNMYNKLTSLTAKNLPFSLFLETTSLGFPAYTGATTEKLPYADIGIIKTQLGIGTISYNPSKYTVTFNLNYSGGGVHTTKQVNANAKVSAPTAPTRAGYSFDGWYTTPQGLTRYDFSKPVTTTMTLYAKWRFTPPPDSSDGYTITWTEQTTHNNCHHYYTYRVTLTPTLTLTPSTLKSGYGFGVQGKGTMTAVSQIGYGGDCEYGNPTKASSITPAWPTSINLNTGWTVPMKMANGSTKTQPNSITLDALTIGSNQRTWQAPKNPISETQQRKVYTNVNLAGTASSPKQHPVVLKMTGGGIPSRRLFFNASNTKYITINGVMYEDDYTGAN